MKKTVLTIKEALAKPHGEYQSGSYLRSSEDMIFDQETWSDEDDARDVDFETYPFWITTDDGEDPYGICDEKDFREFQKDFKMRNQTINFSLYKAAFITISVEFEGGFASCQFLYGESKITFSIDMDEQEIVDLMQINSGGDDMEVASEILELMFDTLEFVDDVNDRFVSYINYCEENEQYEQDRKDADFVRTR